MGLLKPSLPNRRTTPAQVATQGIAPGFSKKTSRKIVDPLGLVKSKPKEPEKTAEEIALEMRQRRELDEQIEETEKRLKSMSRAKLGAQSLLSGASATSKEAASGVRRGGSSGGSLLGGGTTGSSSGRGGGVGGGGGRVSGQAGQRLQ